MSSLAFPPEARPRRRALDSARVLAVGARAYERARTRRGPLASLVAEMRLGTWRGRELTRGRRSDGRFIEAAAVP